MSCLTQIAREGQQWMKLEEGHRLKTWREVMWMPMESDQPVLRSARDGRMAGKDVSLSRSAGIAQGYASSMKTTFSLARATQRLSSVVTLLINASPWRADVTVMHSAKMALTSWDVTSWDGSHELANLQMWALHIPAR